MQRKTARENTFILIFERICKSDETAEEIFQKATEVRGLEYDGYVKQVFFGSEENREIIEQYSSKHTVGWKKERISPVSRAVIRLAVYEMMFMEDIPSRVSINEAIELSKKYDDEKSYSFVNGVLNGVSKELEANNG
ncbi:MAG: transcription antitermination factor NusB [Clostridia bacterium]|nr:transcription antitermination factor NusB [Clostridia bacterium]